MIIRSIVKPWISVQFRVDSFGFFARIEKERRGNGSSRIRVCEEVEKVYRYMLESSTDAAYYIPTVQKRASGGSQGSLEMFYNSFFYFAGLRIKRTTRASEAIVRTEISQHTFHFTIARSI